MSGNNGDKFELKVIIANLGPKFKTGTFLFSCVKNTLNRCRTTVSDGPTLHLLEYGVFMQRRRHWKTEEFGPKPVPVTLSWQ